MSYFVRFLLLCCTVALAIPTYANALNERDAGKPVSFRFGSITR